MITMTLYVRQQKRHRCIEVFWILREGEGGRIRQYSIETCILSYVKEITSPCSVVRKGAQGWCLGMTLRDGMGKKVGGAVQDGEHMYTHG